MKKIIINSCMFVAMLVITIIYGNSNADALKVLTNNRYDMQHIDQFIQSTNNMVDVNVKTQARLIYTNNILHIAMIIVCVYLAVNVVVDLVGFILNKIKNKK